MYASLVDMIEANAGCEKQKKIYFINGEKDEVSCTYFELFKNAKRILGYLQGCGLKPKDELVFQVDDNKSFIEAFWACILGNIIPVPVSVGTNDEHRAKLTKVWNVLGNPFLFADQKGAAVLEKLDLNEDDKKIREIIKSKTINVLDDYDDFSEGCVQRAEGNDIAFIQFSSGSTGEPKGVVLSHENLLANLSAICEAAAFTENDCFLSWMPLTHDMGMIGFHLSPFYQNIDQCIMPTSLFIKRPTLWMAKVNEHRASILSSPNFGYKYFMTFLKPEQFSAWDLSCVRLIFNGAEPISAELCNEFLDVMEQFNLKRNCMFTVYGMAEASVAVTFPPVGKEFVYHTIDRTSIVIGEKVKDAYDTDNKAKFVDEGFPIRDCYVRICDRDDRQLPEDTVGMIQISGRNVTCGYYRNQEATDKAFTEDGWLITGDIGFIRNGRLVITGREKDIIFVKGMNIYPHDVERVCEGVEGIELGRVAVCGVFDETVQSERAVVFIYYKRKLDAFVDISNRVKRQLRKNIGLEVLDVVPVREIPKTTSGKVQRYILAKRYTEGFYSEVLKELTDLVMVENSEFNNEFNNDTEKSLMNVVRDLFKDQKIGIDDNLLEFGGDSIMLTKIRGKIDEIFPDKVKITDLFVYPTVRRLAQYIDMYDAEAIPKVGFPERFIIKSSNMMDRSSLQLSIDESLFANLSETTKRLDMDVYTVLLGVYMFLLSEIAKKQFLAIHTIVDVKARVGTIKLDLHNRNDMINIFEFVDKRRKEIYIKDNQQININNSGMNVKDGSNNLAFLFYRKDYMPNDINVLDIYDIAVEVNKSIESLNIEFIFDSCRINSQELKDMANKYIIILKMITEKIVKSNLKIDEGENKS